MQRSRTVFGGHLTSLILVAACGSACSSPQRTFVSEADGGSESNGGTTTSKGGGQTSSAGTTAISGGASASGGGQSGAGAPTGNGGATNPTNGGTSTTGAAAGQTNASTLGGTTNLGGSGGVVVVNLGGSIGAGAPATTGGSTSVAGNTTTARGGANPTGGNASAGGPATGGTATGGASTGGAATGGAPALPNGQPCANDLQCQSSNCRIAPNSSRYCVVTGSACSTSAGVGVNVNGKFCAGQSSYACSSTDTFAAPITCTGSSPCQLASCDATSGSCALAPGNQGALCPLSGTQGACDGGTCTTLRFPPPSGSTWTYVNSGPLANEPPGCGTSSTFPCAIGDFRFPWPPDTRQVKCYNDASEIPCPGTPSATNCATTSWCGQDAQYGVDVTRPTWATGRYVQSGTSGNDIVTDGITGLVWTVSSTSATQMPWTTAQQFCSDKAGASYGGRTDWNLPTIQQLVSLYAFSSTSEAVPSSEFPGIGSNFPWSRSTYVADIASAWYTGVAVPYIATNARTGGVSSPLSARCAALGNVTAIATPRYYLTGTATEGIVFDSRTNLLWQQTGDTTGRTWSGALAYCEGLTYGGRSDWRLPNVMELASIVDYSRVSPAADPVAFPNTGTGFYWSSTTMGTNLANAWPIRFLDGTLAAWTAGKTGTTNLVRCVAGGPT